MATLRVTKDGDEKWFDAPAGTEDLVLTLSAGDAGDVVVDDSGTDVVVTITPAAASVHVDLEYTTAQADGALPSSPVGADTPQSRRHTLPRPPSGK